MIDVYEMSSRGRERGITAQLAVTVAEVLTTIVLKADPNARGKDPSDPGLKLVWVLAAEPSDPERLLVLVTTRAGAKKRGHKLPEVFESK